MIWGVKYPFNSTLMKLGVGHPILRLPYLLRLHPRAFVYALLFVSLSTGYVVLRGVNWDGSTQLHTVMESMACLLAMVVGVLSLVRFYSKKNNTFLFIGTGFVGTAMLDGYHAVVTSTIFASQFPSAPASLIPWSWIASRVFLSVLLFVSWAAWTREARLGDSGRIGELSVYIAAGVLTLASFMFFAFVPLPRAYYPEHFFHRPEEFVPALFFLIALVGYLRKGHWKYDDFEHWLVMSLIVGFVGQTMFMSFSGTLFDMEFDVAHLLKKVSYLFVLTGLMWNIYRTFRQSEYHQSLLEAEVSERQRGEVALARQAEESELLAQTGRIASSSLDINEVYGSLATEILKLIPFDQINISVIDYEKGTTLPKWVLGIDVPGRNSGKEIPLAGSLAGEVVRTQSPIMLEVASEADIEHRFPLLVPAFNAGLRAFIAVPLNHRDHVIGVLQIRSKEPGIYTQVHLDLFNRIGNQIAGSVDSAELYAEGQRVEAELIKTTEELSRSNQELNQFAHIASHDLQEPLRMVASYTQLLERRYKDKLGSDANEFIGYAVEGAKRMQAQINDLLAYSRVAGQRAPLEATDCANIFNIAVGNLVAGIEESGAVVTRDQLPTLPADSLQLVSVFQNLIGNGIKYHGDQPPRIHVSAVESGDEWLFCVDDNGIGIEFEFTERIFVIFQRLHDRTKYPGTGVGLAFCKIVIERHGGRIWVESKPQKGSAFYFTLPMETQEKSDSMAMNKA